MLVRTLKILLQISLLIMLNLGAVVAFGQKSNPKVSTDTLDELTDTSDSEILLTKIDSAILVHPATKIDSLIKYAHTFLGNRYRRGGTSVKGFDCSGYTMTVFKKFDIKLPHTSAGQGLMGVDIAKPNIRKGDLILFRGRGRKGKRIGHVGIVISEKGEPVRFIHSSTSEGVRIDHLEYQYYKKRYIKTIRMPELYRK